MVKLLKIHSCYTCPNMEYIDKFGKWYCILTDNVIKKHGLINDDCPLEEAEEEMN